MRIPEHYNDKYNLKMWSRKDVRVQKVHEDQFENELENCIGKRKSRTKKKTKNLPKETGLRDTANYGVQSVGDRFSSWS